MPVNPPIVVTPTVPIQSKPISYYQNLFTSEYRLSPRVNAWLIAVLSIFQDINTLYLQFQNDFDLDSAVGVQLDVIGQLVGVPRTVLFQPTGTGYANLFNSGVILEKGPFFPTSGIWNGLTIFIAGSTYTIASVLTNTTIELTVNTGLNLADATFVVEGCSSILDDAAYRVLIRATVAKNYWNGTQNGLWSAWQSIFPGTKIIIHDNQNMTATILVTGSLTSIEQDLISNGLIVPRPETVQYDYFFGNMPVFGFDLDTALIAGFDTGYWV